MNQIFKKKSMDELGRADAGEHRESVHFPVTIILDSVRSMHNVGSVFRTADATNVSQIVLCGLTPRPPHRDIQKTALGATESVHWTYYTSIMEAVMQLKEEDYQIIAVEQVHNSISLADAPFKKDQKLAFIFGNEVYGVSDEVLTFCDYCLEIPQFGTKHSFNISVSAGIVLWEWIRKTTV